MPLSEWSKKRIEFLAPAAGGWRSESWGDTTIHFAGDPAAGDIARSVAAVLASSSDPNGVARRCLSEAMGFFALVVDHPRGTLCAVDAIRSVPLIWAQHEGRTIIAQRGRDLTAGLGWTPPVDMSQATALAAAGYTIGAATLLSGVETLLPGQMLTQSAEAMCPEIENYRSFRPWIASPKVAGGDDHMTETEALKALGAVLRGSLTRTIEKADGRMIALPLSAGRDSRLVASGLRELGYNNVRCFAYGLPGNREALASKAIADRLGYDWTFVPYSNRWMRAQFAGDAYRSYLDYADSLTAVHFAQDFPAIAHLRDTGFIPPDAIIVNGQSGDFITGNHIPPALRSPSLFGVEAAVAQLSAKHFSQWGHLADSSVQNRVQRVLRQELRGLVGDEDPESLPSYALYEASEYIDRQSKYVVNGQRAYEVLGFDWDLPLWDPALIDFFESAPLSHKIAQNLFRKTLHALDWGGVWSDIPINETQIRPGWMRPLRFALKLAHLPLGRERWHQFERRYLAYFMAPLCGYAERGWRAVATDSRRPRGALALHIESYLNRHGVDIDSLSQDGQA